MHPEFQISWWSSYCLFSWGSLSTITVQTFSFMQLHFSLKHSLENILFYGQPSLQWWTFVSQSFRWVSHIDQLMHEIRNSNALSMELLFSSSRLFLQVCGIKRWSGNAIGVSLCNIWSWYCLCECFSVLVIADLCPVGFSYLWSTVVNKIW